MFAQKINAIFYKFIGLRSIILILLTISFLSAIFSILLDPPKNLREWFSAFFGSLATEIVGALLVFLILEYAWELKKKQAELIDKLKDSNKSVVESAHREIMSSPKHILRGANLYRSNFESFQNRYTTIYFDESFLSGANFRDAELVKISMVSVFAEGANFSNTNLMSSDLQRSKFWACKFDMANLENINLSNATFWRCSLIGAN